MLPNSTSEHHSNTEAEQPLVSLVILNHNGERQLECCFQSVLTLEYSNYEVVFVDNGSTDNSLAVATKALTTSKLPHTIVRLGRNLGYCGGKNAGANAAKGKLIWLLDNDIQLEPSSLTKLVDFIKQNPDVALCGPVLYDIDRKDRIVGGGFLLSYVRQPRSLKKFPRNSSHGHLVSYISGATMFVRKSVWDALGGFDESGKFFLDDNDFGPRCWIAGWKVAVVQDAVAYHFEISRRSHEYWRWRFQQFPRGTIRGMIRNYSPKSLLLTIPSFATFMALKGLKNIIFRKDPRILVDCASSLAGVILDLPQSLRQRGEIQLHRVTPKDDFLTFLSSVPLDVQPPRQVKKIAKKN